jgi:uncharacterized protein (TIGR03086 family)
MEDQSAPTPSALDLDRLALDQLIVDMVRVSDDDLAKPTPCADWTVRDLIVHMNNEHPAICGAPLNDATDPRTAFTVIAGEWLTFAAAAGDTITVPKMGTELPTDMVLATHFADMLVHRWDLATALGKSTGTPESLLAAAHRIADVVTAPGSPLVGVAYQPALTQVAGDSAEQSLVRKFGRDPKWPTSRAEQQEDGRKRADHGARITTRRNNDHQPDQAGLRAEHRKR